MIYINPKKLIFMKSNGGASGASRQKTKANQTTGVPPTPFEIKGTREERAKKFEAIAKKFKRPDYITDQTLSIEKRANDAVLYFHNNYWEGITSYVHFPSGRKASELEKEGAIISTIQYARPELEDRISHRFMEFPTIELAQKYSGQRLNREQLREVFKVANQEVIRVMGSPISQREREELSFGRFGDSLPANEWE